MRQRLVKVVDVENDVPLGRCEAAKVEQMAIAASLHARAGDGGLGQVGRHDAGGAAIEGERRHQHPPVAHRQQFGQPLMVRGLKLRNRIGAAGRLLPAAVGRPGSRVAQLLAGIHQFVQRTGVVRPHHGRRWRGDGEDRCSLGCSAHKFLASSADGFKTERPSASFSCLADHFILSPARPHPLIHLKQQDKAARLVRRELSFKNGVRWPRLVSNPGPEEYPTWFPSPSRASTGKQHTGSG
jgi:hypothetical protein